MVPSSKFRLNASSVRFARVMETESSTKAHLAWSLPGLPLFLWRNLSDWPPGIEALVPHGHGILDEIDGEIRRLLLP
jgi:hypothetical protein